MIVENAKPDDPVFVCHYLCGCTAKGLVPLPPYCPKHGIIERDKDMRRLRDFEPEKLARLFHETYERLAPEFGYRTREESAKPWAEVPEQNRRLMIAVCDYILDAARAAVEGK